MQLKTDKILEHITNQKEFKPIGIKENKQKEWIKSLELALLKGQESSFYAELYVLSNFLNEYNLKLMTPHGWEFDFKPAISYVNEARNKYKWVEEWCGKNGKHTKQFRNFFTLKDGVKDKYPRATFAFLNMHKFKVISIIENIPLEKLPPCQELLDLAEELKEKRGKEPTPDEIFDLWQAHNGNLNLDDNIREKLCYKCFSELT